MRRSWSNRFNSMVHPKKRMVHTDGILSWRNIPIALTTTGQPPNAFSFEECFTLYWKEIGISVAGAFGTELL